MSARAPSVRAVLFHCPWQGEARGAPLGAPTCFSTCCARRHDGECVRGEPTRVGSLEFLVEQQLLEHQEQRLQCGQHQVELAHVLRGEQARVLRRVQRDVEVQILSARRRHGGQRHDGHGGLLYARRGDARQTLEPGLQGGQRVQLRLHIGRPLEAWHAKHHQIHVRRGAREAGGARAVAGQARARPNLAHLELHALGQRARGRVNLPRLVHGAVHEAVQAVVERRQRLARRQAERQRVLKIAAPRHRPCRLPASPVACTCAVGLAARLASIAACCLFLVPVCARPRLQPAAARLSLWTAWG
eukprot:scaffold10026_cov62-Phaeocystis_antarctica.AAC.9